MLADEEFRVAAREQRGEQDCIGIAANLARGAGKYDQWNRYALPDLAKDLFHSRRQHKRAADEQRISAASLGVLGVVDELGFRVLVGVDERQKSGAFRLRDVEKVVENFGQMILLLTLTPAPLSRKRDLRPEGEGKVGA